MSTSHFKSVQLENPAPDVWNLAVTNAISGKEPVSVLFRLSGDLTDEWVAHFIRLYRVRYNARAPIVYLQSRGLEITCLPSALPQRRAMAQVVIAETNEIVAFFRHYEAVRAGITRTTQQRKNEWIRERRKPRSAIPSTTPTREADRLIDERIRQTAIAETALDKYLAQHEMEQALQIMIDEDLRKAEAVAESVEEPAKSWRDRITDTLGRKGKDEHSN